MPPDRRSPAGVTMKEAALFLSLVFASSVAGAQQYFADITYCQANGLDLQMDMARDDAFSGPRPTVIFVHGGGWYDGTKEDYTSAALFFASSGYVAFTLSYRLTSLPTEFDDPYAVGAQYPDPVEDVGCALDHILTNAEQYAVDQSRVAFFGDSAGAHLALLTAYRDTRIAAVVAWYTPTQLLKLYQTSAEADRIVRFLGGTPAQVGAARYSEASPVSYVGEDSQPTLVIQGTADTIVPPAQARLLQQALAPFSRVSRFIYIQGADHGLAGYRIQALQKSIDFLNRLFEPLESR
jgi:acetyl esterase/lipase